MPADTFSSSLGWLVMGTGNDNNNWGDNHNNQVSTIFEKAIAGQNTRTVTGGTLDLSAAGSNPPNAASQAIEAILSFTGTLTSTQAVKVPNLTKWWIVNNATSGAFALQMQTPSGSAVAVPQGGWALVWCDGANNIKVGYSSVQVQAPDGTLAAPGLSFSAETGTGLRRNGAGDVRLTILGVDIVDFKSDGTVNLLTGQLQIAGVQAVPPGAEMPYAGIFAPAGWLLEFGQAISRTGANASLFAAITATATGTIATGNGTMSGVSVDFRGNGVEGAFVEGTGIPTGTTIQSVTANSILMSQVATGNATGTIRILPYGQGDGSTTFNVPDRRGAVVAGRDNMGGAAASRLTSGGSGVKGNQLGNASAGGQVGGQETNTHVPAHTHGVTEPNSGQGHRHVANAYDGSPDVSGVNGSVPANSASNIYRSGGTTNATFNSAFVGLSPTGITINSTGDSAVTNVQPTGISNMIIKL